VQVYHAHLRDMEEQVNTIDTVYKVVIRLDTGMYSSCFPPCEEMRRDYALGSDTFPFEGTYLYAFANKDSARRFVSEHDFPSHRLGILECEAEVIQAKRLPAISANDRNLDAILTWWKLGARILGFLNQTPIGTVWCLWIRPVRVARKLEG